MAQSLQRRVRLREALAIRRRVLPAGHVEIPCTRVKLIPALIAPNEYGEAGDEVRRAQDEFQRAHDSTAKDRQVLQGLAQSLAQQAGSANTIEVK